MSDLKVMPIAFTLKTTTVLDLQVQYAQGTVSATMQTGYQAAFPRIERVMLHIYIVGTYCLQPSTLLMNNVMLMFLR